MQKYDTKQKRMLQRLAIKGAKNLLQFSEYIERSDKKYAIYNLEQSIDNMQKIVNKCKKL